VEANVNEVVGISTEGRTLLSERSALSTQFVERAIPHLDKPFKLTICVTQTCNMDCKLCYADCHTKTELTTQQWKDFIDNLVAEGFLHIYFEGGEPFHRPDFEEILAHCSRKLFVAIRTHAGLIDAERAKRIKAFGVGRIYVDLFAAIPEIQDNLTGHPGSYDEAVAGIRAARAAGIKVNIQGILSRHNAPHLQMYLDLAKELDADQVGILRLYPLGRARKNWNELSLPLSEMMAALNGLQVPPGIQLMQSWHPKDGNCCWQNAAVSPEGNSIGCPYLREYVNYGNITEMSLVETWNNPLYAQLRANDVEDHCPDCSATQGTHGGCRSTAFAFHDRFTAPDPYCTHTNNGVDLRVLPQRLLSKNT
jgi:radical SAM protein with 4Fe4S-binding SPASM domain